MLTQTLSNGLWQSLVTSTHGSNITKNLQTELCRRTRRISKNKYLTILNWQLEKGGVLGTMRNAEVPAQMPRTNGSIENEAISSPNLNK
jgi:hypothetical protein